MKSVMGILGRVLGAAVLALCIYYLTTHPTNEGPWQPQYAQLASFDISDDHVVISNFRRARYDESGSVSSITWEQREVDLANLKDVWLGISVFGEPGLAHTFLSFDFGDGDPVVISVEARQRPSQKFDPVLGMLDKFHLIYVMADERDIIGLRTHIRGEEVFFQPLKIDHTRAETLFRHFAKRANQLSERPEFYNTLMSNCTNGLLEDTKLPGWRRYLDPNIVLPANSDRVAYAFGILDTRYSLDELRRAAHIDPSSLTPEEGDFSNQVRAGFFARMKARQ